MPYQVCRSLRHFAVAGFFALLLPLLALELMQGIYHAAKHADILVPVALAASVGNTDQQSTKPPVQKADYRPASGAPRRLTDLAGTDEQAWASVPRRHRRQVHH